MLGGVTDAIEADSTILDGGGTPPRTFVGVYGTNTAPLPLSFSATIWVVPSVTRRGSAFSADQASSIVSAQPHTMWLNCRCQLPPGVGPTLSMTMICRPKFVPYFR